MLDRLENLPARTRWVAGVVGAVLIYAIALRLPGLGPWLERKAPFAVIVIGLITGTVTSLLAMGLILIYRANRFINFAYGAMGSLVGVLAIGMHLQHGWLYFLVLPLGVLGGVAVGGLTELL